MSYQPLTDEDLKRLIEAMEENERNLTREEALKQLQEEGILDENGKLAEPYRLPPVDIEKVKAQNLLEIFGEERINSWAADIANEFLDDLYDLDKHILDDIDVSYFDGTIRITWETITKNYAVLVVDGLIKRYYFYWEERKDGKRIRDGFREYCPIHYIVGMLKELGVRK